MSDSKLDRLHRIAMTIIAEAGVQDVIYRETHDGIARFRTGEIECPPPTTKKRLLVLAHECGHVALQHASRKMLSHRAEYEAERYGLRALEVHGEDVPQSMTEVSQRYVAGAIAIDVREFRLCQIDQEAYLWVEKWVRPQIRDRVERGQITLCSDFPPFVIQPMRLSWYPGRTAER